MKKRYEKPLLEIEEYELNMSIAYNCAMVVSNGPAVGSHTLCSDYGAKDPFEMDDEGDAVMAASVYNVSFYEESCDCYYSAGGEGYWTS